MSPHSADQRRKPSLEELGDFTTTAQVIPISLIAIVIGIISAFVAWFLLKLIGFFTNLAYYHRFDTSFASPAGNHLGMLCNRGARCRVAHRRIDGAIWVGAYPRARYPGSDRVHFDERQSGPPRLAVLKPLSAAISIGTGGPFGAEGPIIMTGGAFGSMIGQFFHLTSVERRTLLVAGACAGMSATFAAPLSSVLIGVELLLFEWKPRSAIPVALASATACVARRYILGLGPLFPVPPHPAFIGPHGLGGCVVAGLAAGAPFSTADPRSLCRRRSVSEAADSLDVVARHRRRVRRNGRPHFSRRRSALDTTRSGAAARETFRSRFLPEFFW